MEEVKGAAGMGSADKGAMLQSLRSQVGVCVSCCFFVVVRRGGGSLLVLCVLCCTNVPGLILQVGACMSWVAFSFTR